MHTTTTTTIMATQAQLQPTLSTHLPSHHQSRWSTHLWDPSPAACRCPNPVTWFHCILPRPAPRHPASACLPVEDTLSSLLPCIRVVSLQLAGLCTTDTSVRYAAYWGVGRYRERVWVHLTSLLDLRWCILSLGYWWLLPTAKPYNDSCNKRP